MPKIKHAYFIAAFFFLFTVNGFTQQWITVKCDSRFNFSGMALVESKDDKTTLLVVHDNKDQPADRQTNPLKNKTERVGLLIIEGKENRPRLVSLKWIDKDGTENKLPVDLEAITPVPDMPNHFMTISGNPFDAEEKGKAYLIKLDVEKQEARVVNSLKLPITYDGRDFESLAIQKIGNTLLAVWADRGREIWNNGKREGRPATLFWGQLDLSKVSIKFLGQEELRMPLPAIEDWKNVSGGETRSASEIKIDTSGGLFVSSAFDSGDDGPFASAFYFAGVFTTQGSTIKFIKSANAVKLYEFKNYKIESFELLPNGVVFGTDDENFGASVFIN